MLDKVKGAKVQNDQNPTMNPLRMAVFPVMNTELYRFIPMAVMVFFTIFAFSLLRNFKDALITTAPGGAAEVLPFLKAYVVLPCSIAASLAYMRLKKAADFKSAYFIIVSFFVAFFALFAFVLYPSVDSIHPSKALLNSLQSAYPRLQFLFPIWANWTYSIFYVIAELWGTFALSVLFWQFANDTTSPEEAKRFYPLYVLSGNIGLILIEPTFSLIEYSGITDVTMVCGISACSGLAMMATFWHINAHVLPYSTPVSKAPKKKKAKLSFGESLRVLVRSEYIGYIALLVLSYGMIINVVEVVWKAQVRTLFTTRATYAAFMAAYTKYTGIATIVMNYTSKGIIRKFGWITGAMVTPIACGVFSSIFFVYVLNQSLFESLIPATYTALSVAVWFGAYSVLLSKGSKYSFFDPTKEMAFIPLDSDLRTNGKAAVDGVGGRLGKSAGGLITTGLLVLTGTNNVINVAQYLGAVVVVLTLGWVFSVIQLNSLYLKQLRESEESEKSENNKGATAYA